MKQTKTYLPYVALVIAFILWGVNVPIIKLGLQSIPVYTLLAVKMIVSALILLPFALKTWKRVAFRDLGLLIIGSIIWVCVGNIALYTGLKLAPSINAGVITLLSPLLLFVLSIELLKENFTAKTFIGILLALFGSFIIVAQPILTGSEDLSTNLLGNSLFMLFVFANVVGTLISKKVVVKMSSAQATFIHLIAGGIPVCVIALSQANNLMLEAVPASGWVAIIYGILAVIFANFFFMYGLQRIPAKDVSVFYYIQPIATVLAAALILSELPDSYFLLGTAAIFIGIYLAEAHVHYWPRLHPHHQHH